MLSSVARFLLGFPNSLSMYPLFPVDSGYTLPVESKKRFRQTSLKSPTHGRFGHGNK